MGKRRRKARKPRGRYGPLRKKEKKFTGMYYQRAAKAGIEIQAPTGEAVVQCWECGLVETRIGDPVFMRCADCDAAVEVLTFHGIPM